MIDTAITPRMRTLKWDLVTAFVMRRTAVESVSFFDLSDVSDAEHAEMSMFRAPQRKLDWIAGRTVAKQLLEDVTGYSTKWEILSRTTRQRGQPPRVYLNGNPYPCFLSISHSERFVAAAITLHPTEFIGIDLVENDDIPSAFARDWFSTEEVERLEGWGMSSTAAWSIKEAAFKSLRTQEAFNPRTLSITDRDGEMVHVSASTSRSITVMQTSMSAATVSIARSWPCRHLIT